MYMMRRVEKCEVGWYIIKERLSRRERERNYTELFDILFTNVSMIEQGRI